MGPAAPQANTDRRPKALGNAVFTAEGQEVAACPRRLLYTSAQAQLLPPPGRNREEGAGHLAISQKPLPGPPPPRPAPQRHLVARGLHGGPLSATSP